MQSERRGFLAAIGALFASCFAWAIPATAQKPKKSPGELDRFIADSPSSFQLARSLDASEFPRLKEAMLKITDKIIADPFLGYEANRLYVIEAISTDPATGRIECYVTIAILNDHPYNAKLDRIYLNGKFDIDSILAAKVVPACTDKVHFAVWPPSWV